ncbi:hypothetical protein GCM10010136_15250 [Limoniibacter endophyticus]|uniref:DUF2336 domain-containing protein n=1 Tax=Limoniibacter endophyticus TaxID=1565040 RepID=A0A8J3DN38_9HYPH|nr:hypothetical protein GCM10010136_15250 [Limoniibacter endophyticus]
MPRASKATLAYVCAMLSECTAQPPRLLRLLCNQPIDVCAPLLLRSVALSSMDFLTIIGRRGLGHAKVIAARTDLDPQIRDLIATLTAAPAVVQPAIAQALSIEVEPAAPEKMQAPLAPASLPGGKAEAVREQLRSYMKPAGPDGIAQARTDFAVLRAAALSGIPSQIIAAFAARGRIDLSTARRVATSRDPFTMLVGLRKHELAVEQAFFIVAAILPEAFNSTADIRNFASTYAAIGPEEATALLKAFAGSLRTTIPSPLDRDFAVERSSV